LNFKEFLEREEIIEQLKNKYLGGTAYNNFEKILDEIIQKFFKLNPDEQSWRILYST